MLLPLFYCEWSCLTYVICVCLRILVFLVCLSSPCLRFVYQMLPVSLDCPFLIDCSVFSNDYLLDFLPIKMSRPTIKMSHPTIKMSRPTIKMSRPTIKMSRPTIKMSRPTIKMSRPTIKMSRPTIKMSRPTNSRRLFTGSRDKTKSRSNASYLGSRLVWHGFYVKSDII